MRNGLLAFLAALWCGAGAVVAQVPKELDKDLKAETIQTSAATEEALCPIPEADPDLLPITDPVIPCGPAKPGCGAPCCFYASGEYLLWWLKGFGVPPLITTGPATFPVAFLGNPGTVVLLGGNDLSNDNPYSGGRFTAGIWIDQDRTLGLEGNFLFLAEQSSSASFGSDNFPVLARPFFNLNLGTEFSQLNSFPGIATGGKTVSSSTDLWGGEANLRKIICCGCCGCDGGYQLSLLGGFRYLDLDDNLHIFEAGQLSPDLPVPVTDFAGLTFSVVDQFDTRNQFYGGQLGLGTYFWWRKLVVDLRAKVALGSTRQQIDIHGGQLIIEPDGTASTFLGGVLALPSNIGSHQNGEFSVIPEVNVNFGYQMTHWLRAFVGYTFLYWTNVVRAGDQVDRVVDISQIPNFGFDVPPVGARPAVPFKDVDFWAQGINFGLEFRW